MSAIVFLLLGLAGFGAMFAYVALCDRL